MDWSNLNTQSGGRTPKMSDVVDVVEWRDGDFVRVRPIGPIAAYAFHWIRTKTERGATPCFPKMCLAFDRLTGEFHQNRDVCPYCSSPFPAYVEFYSNFIVREIQENQPHRRLPLFPEERKEATLFGQPCRFKSKSSKSWTPIRAGRITNKLGSRFKTLVKLNTWTNRRTGEVKSFSLSNARCGTDILVYYEAGPPARYDAQKGDKTRLTDEERNYLWQNIALLRPETADAALRSFHMLQPKFIVPRDYYADGNNDYEPKQRAHVKRNHWDYDDDERA